MAIRECTKNLSSTIYESLEEHWKKNDTRAKFMELEDLMEARAGSSDFLATIYLNRLNCLICNIVGGGVLFNWFVYRIFDLDSFNCLLPEYYHYESKLLSRFLLVHFYSSVDRRVLADHSLLFQASRILAARFIPHIHPVLLYFCAATLLLVSQPQKVEDCIHPYPVSSHNMCRCRRQPF